MKNTQEQQLLNYPLDLEHLNQLRQEQRLERSQTQQSTFLYSLVSYLTFPIKSFSQFILDNQNHLHENVYHILLTSFIPSMLKLELSSLEKILFLSTLNLLTADHLSTLFDLDHNRIKNLFSYSPLALSAYSVPNELPGSSSIKAFTLTFSFLKAIDALDSTIARSSLDNKNLFFYTGCILTLKVLAELTQRLPINSIAEITQQCLKTTFSFITKIKEKGSESIRAGRSFIDKNTTEAYYFMIERLPRSSYFTQLHLKKIIYLIEKKEFNSLPELLKPFWEDKLFPTRKGILIHYLVQHFKNHADLESVREAGIFFKKKNRRRELSYLFYQITALCLEAQMKTNSDTYYRCQFNCGFALQQLANQFKKEGRENNKKSIKVLLKQAKKHYKIASQAEKTTISAQNQEPLAVLANECLSKITKELADIETLHLKKRLN